MRHALRHLKKSDPILAAIIERVGPYRMTFREPIFDTLIRSIAFQQLNGNAARSIFERLVAAAAAKAGVPTPVDGWKLTPESLLALTPEEMRSVGLSRQKLAYMRDLAERTRSGEIDFARLPQMSDEEVIEHLTRVKGIGVWSAQMFLMFALERPNVLPTLDYGVRAAIKKHYRKRKLPNHKQIVKIARAWQPYCSMACWYLWRSSDTVI